MSLDAATVARLRAEHRVDPDTRPTRPTRVAAVGDGPTPRMAQMLDLAADGYENAEIAEQLHVTVDTVKTTFAKLYDRIGARNRAHAVAIGYQRGWLSLLPERRS